jgi:amino acid permease
MATSPIDYALDEKNIGINEPSTRVEHAGSASDGASGGAFPEQHTELKRQLKNRHIAMIR